jgi:hypothetical protein
MSEQQTTKTTLASSIEGNVESINKDALYMVAWEKLTGVEDLVIIFASMGLSFAGHHPHFETIKHLLDLENPIIPNQPIPPAPERTEIKLPKLKKVD